MAESLTIDLLTVVRTVNTVSEYVATADEALNLVIEAIKVGKLAEANELMEKVNLLMTKANEMLQAVGSQS